MSPRPRKVSDEEIYAAAHRAMRRLGPGELTLDEIGKEAGVTAGALVQRFGSKRQLLLSLSSQAAGGTGEMMLGLRAQASGPVAAIRAYAACMADLAESPAALARNLAYLQIDLTDSDFRKHLVKMARSTRTGLEKLVMEAIAAGELHATTDARRLARMIETTVSGSLITWATYRQGPPDKWLLQDVDAVLEPWLSKKRQTFSRGMERSRYGETKRK
jgi:AcrR family transcriptional regulator